MALTATATSTMRIKVERRLGMSDPVLIVKSPDKSNVLYSCLELTKKLQWALFTAIVNEIRFEKNKFASNYYIL